MKFKSPVYTQVSGSIGGLTYAHNKGGLYARARSIPVNPNSNEQRAVRNGFSSLVTEWTEGLTAAQRDAWSVYATNVPKTDTLGDPLQLSGQQWYIGANTPRLQAGLARVDDGPTIFDRGVIDETLSVAVDEASQEITVTYDDTLAWADEDGSAMLVYASRPVNPTINYFRGPFRLAGSIAGDSVTPPTSPGTIAVPFPVVEDQRVFVEIAFTRADGRLSSRSRFLADVVA